jgi:hypothetical protein
MAVVAENLSSQTDKEIVLSLPVVMGNGWSRSRYDHRYFRSVGPAKPKPPDYGPHGRSVVPEVAGTDHIENGICEPLPGLLGCPVGLTQAAAMRRTQQWLVGYCDVADSEGQRTGLHGAAVCRSRACLAIYPAQRDVP